MNPPASSLLMMTGGPKSRIYRKMYSTPQGHLAPKCKFLNHMLLLLFVCSARQCASRHREHCNLTKSAILRNRKGPSINDVTHFLTFLTPLSPLSPILLNRLMELHHLLADPLPPKCLTSFMDGPKGLPIFDILEFFDKVSFFFIFIALFAARKLRFFTPP